MAYMYLCRVFRNGLLLKSGILSLFVLLGLNGLAQVSLTNGLPTATIDFSASMPAGVGNGAFTGAGFQPTPTSGQLDSDAWAITGFDDGTLNFGGTQTGNDFALGATSIAQAQGGIYAFTGLPGSSSNPALMIQPANGNFTPGTITLRIRNMGTSAITQLAVEYDIFVRNDQPRGNSFNFSWSPDNTSYTAVPALNYTSGAAADALGWVRVGAAPSRTTTITGINVTPGSYFYIRWSGADVSGSTERDEFGLDNIKTTATYAAVCTPPSTNATSTGFSNVLPGQMDVNFTRGSGSGGLMVIAVQNAALNANPFNGTTYVANSNFGTGDAVGNGFVVYNSNAVLPAPGGAGSFTVLGLNPSTSYRFYFIEYNGVGSPCYQLVYPNAVQATIASVANPAGYFKSRISGNWNNANTWNYSSTGAAPWVLSDLKPTSAAAGITIDSGHTVTLVANESAAKLLVNWSGTLDNTNGTLGGYRLTMVDKAGDDLTVNGTLKLYGNIPTLVSGLNVVVNTGGMVHVLNNSGDAASDDFARSSQVKFYTDAVFNWNTILSFETSGLSYFTNLAAEVPIFRISSKVSVGAGTPLSIHGLLEVNATASFNFTGAKTFRNGITGTDTLNQSGGGFLITATPALGSYKIGGAGVINLSDSTLRITTNASGILISNKIIHGGITRILSTAYLNTDIYTLSGTTSFIVDNGGFLGVGSPLGITTGATGNLQTGTRTLSTLANYRYTGYGNQVTGDLLPATVNTLSIQGPPSGGSGAVVSLTQPVTVTGITSILNGWVLNIASATLTCNNALSYAGGGFLRGTFASNLVLTGGSSQSIIFEPNSSLGLLTMRKSGGTASWNSDLNGNLDIYEGIFFEPPPTANAGTLNFQARSITLKSGPLHTAYVSQLYGAIQNATKITVERYIPTGTDHGKSWQLLAVPLNTTQTINQAWQDTATSANQNRYPGYGTMITGTTADPSFTLGFDAHTPVGSTMRTFAAGTTGSWVDIANTKSTAITNKKGYMVLVRGDRSVTAVSGPNSTAVPTVLRAKGTLYYGNTSNAAPVTMIANNTFESVANPYACTIDFSTLTLNAAADKTFYAWDPLLPGSSGLGAYQTISQSAGWIPNPGGTLNYPTGVPVTTIQSGQAVLMHATGGTGNVLFQEANKVISSENVFRQPVRNSMLQARLYTASGNLADGNMLILGNQFSNGYDGRDAVKATNTGENFGIAAHSKIISILTRNTLNAGDTIHYQMWNLPRGRFTLKFSPENFSGRENAWLGDRFTGTETPVSREELTSYEFEITQAAASYQPNRFFIVFRNAISRADDEITPSISIAPNPVTGRRVGVVFTNVPAGQYQVAIMQSGGALVLRKTVYSSGRRDVMHFDLPPSAIPGVYRLIAEGRRWRSDAMVVVE